MGTPPSEPRENCPDLNCAYVKGHGGKHSYERQS